MLDTGLVLMTPVTPTLATSDVQDAALGFLAAHERDVVKLILDVQRHLRSPQVVG